MAKEERVCTNCSGVGDLPVYTRVTCSHCKGEGCKTCSGRGYFTDVAYPPGGGNALRQTCPVCNGKKFEEVEITDS